MGIIDTMKSFLQGTTPAQELKEIRAKIAACIGEIAQIDAEIERRALPVLRGDMEALRIAGELRATKAEIEERLVTLRQGEARSVATVNAETAAAKRAEALARPRRQAQMMADFLAADRELRMQFQDAGLKLRAHIGRAAALATELGDQLGRPFSPSVWMSRFRSALTHNFALGDGVHRAENNLLGLRSDAIGLNYFSEIDELDELLLADICPLYLTEDAALAAQARLAKRHARDLAQTREAMSRRAVGPNLPDNIAPAGMGAVDTIVARAGEVFMLIHHRALFASRADANAAFLSSSVWRAGGYAVIDWQEGAAIVRADLAGIVEPIAPPAPAKVA
jgi:hypothetical protein